MASVWVCKIQFCFPDKMIINEALAGAPLLLLANKQDLEVSCYMISPFLGNYT